MTSPVIVSGDQLQFDILFGYRKVFIPAPQIIKGSGHASVHGKNVCIKGDEGNVIIVNATYVTDTHSVPGTGIVTIKSLHSSQLAGACNSLMPLITAGQDSFIACFTPVVPAMLPPPVSVADVTVESYGKGKFIASQDVVSA